jgi:hypothetical protein
MAVNVKHLSVILKKEKNNNKPLADIHYIDTYSSQITVTKTECNKVIISRLFNSLYSRSNKTMINKRLRPT